MSYQKILSYLFEQLPLYQRIGKAAYKSDLSNTNALCKVLNHPENKFKSIHIAGTNGKGSTSHILASILQEAGYRVGLYTSPHLKDFRERIKINGEMIAKNEVVAFVEKYKSDFEPINLSFFEWTVGLAFHYFAHQKVDVVVLETGLGGRLDSTNVVLPELSVITNIGLDHTQFLGNTFKKIALEKAGIIKPNVPVVIGETQAETQSIFETKAKALNSPIQFADNATSKTLKTDLKGNYQQKNVTTSIAAINCLIDRGWHISANNIAEGLQNVVKNTGLLGRWQVLSKKPLTICDTAHNEAGIKELVGQLSDTPHHHLHMVFGAVNDKSVDKVLELLPKKASYYFCAAKIPRAMAVEELVEIANQKGLKGISCFSVKNALALAQQSAKKDDLIFIGGSTFVVAEVV